MPAKASSYALTAPRRCLGAILVSSLLLLVIITVLALGASRVTRTRAAVTISLQQGVLAFQAAEATLAAGERVVNEPDFMPPPVPCSQGRCRVYARGAVDLAAARRSVEWWREHGWGYAQEPSGTRSDSAGETWFVLEKLAKYAEDPAPTVPSSVPEPDYYRITAASLLEGRIKVVLQSVVARAPTGSVDDSNSEAGVRVSGRQSWRQLY